MGWSPFATQFTIVRSSYNTVLQQTPTWLGLPASYSILQIKQTCSREASEVSINPLELSYFNIKKVLLDRIPRGYGEIRGVWTWKGSEVRAYDSAAQEDLGCVYQTFLDMQSVRGIVRSNRWVTVALFDLYWGSTAAKRKRAEGYVGWRKGTSKASIKT